MKTGKPIIDAAFGKTPSRQPIWFLRQAGRYLPEYRKMRTGREFMDLCQNPELAKEVTLQPLRRFDLDGAIIFSDILVPCTILGQTLTFDKGHGPVLQPAIRTAEQVKAMTQWDISKINFVGEAIANVKSSLNDHQTMIGFAGAPFTVATYMIEGKASKTFSEVKKLRYSQPEVFQSLLSHLVDVTVDYLKMQIHAGAEYLMLFDTWSNQLNQSDFEQFILPPVTTIIKQIKSIANIPMVYYPGQGMTNYFGLSKYNGDVIAVDWRPKLSTVVGLLQHQLGLDVSIQGNLDPFSVLADETTLRKKVDEVIEQGRSARGHIFNVGHGLQPLTDPQAIEWIVDQIRNAH